jgi:hypothetical protein
VEPARVSIEAKSKSAEAPVPKAAAKMAKAASKMPAVTAAHRKSVASKAASNKAMNAPAKTAATTRERCRSSWRHRCRADGKCCRKRDHHLALGISPRFGADAGSKDEIAERRHYSWAARDLFYLFMLVLYQPPQPTLFAGQGQLSMGTQWRVSFASPESKNIARE